MKWMSVPTLSRVQGSSPPRVAFVLYQPKTATSKGKVSCNTPAWQILTDLPSPSKEGEPKSFDLPSLCSRWKRRFDEKSGENDGPPETETPDPGFIDLHQSRRRRYGIRGFILSSQPGGLHTKKSPRVQYVFLLERIVPEGLNLPIMFRQWNLNRREQQIVQALLADQSNKELAHTLGISLNTVKGYLKLMMRKLGVNSRTGILTRILTGKSSLR